MTGPNIASHFIMAHGGTGEIIAERAMNGRDVVMNTSISENPSALENTFDPMAP